MAAELLVDFREFWSRLRDDISAANEYIYIQTFALEGDSIGKQLGAALLASNARDKRVLADSFTRVVLSDRFRYSPANLFDKELNHEARETRRLLSQLNLGGVQVKFTNAYGFSPRRLLSRNHKKLIVIDQNIAYLGGVNFSEHNAAWHDMMVRLDDQAAVSFLQEDFLSTWDGKDRIEHESFAGGHLFTLDGRQNRHVFQCVLDLIDQARCFLFVTSPYITFPFYEHLREAARRGIDVKIVTPEQNNWSHFAKYARLESARSPIDLRFYKPGMTHLKAMLVDDEYLIAGSSNFDYLSYRLYQEILAIFTDAKLISDFRERVMRRDLADSVAVDCRASTLEKNWLDFQTKVVNAALTILT